VDASTSNSPRILILESDSDSRSTLRDLVVKGLPGSSVQASNLTLPDAVADADRLTGFDLLLVGCDFATDGSAENATLKALRTLSADPDSPAVVLLPEGGSEYTAVQSIKAGAVEYIPKQLMGREQVISTIEKATLARRPAAALGSIDGAKVDSDVELFGYDVKRCLASHDNVSIHVAYSAERKQEVVLKVLHREQGSISKDRNFNRFVKEFKLLYDIHDAAVPEIYDFRVTPQYCYITMEYFMLGHLGRALSRDLDAHNALRIAVEIARALSIIHAAGVTHLDLKPANMMLREDGSVALIDFGISRATSLEIPDTVSGSIRGTPYYMSPEQAQGMPTDERTDLYAVGIILFQLLSASKPFVGDTPQEILEQHCVAPIPHLPDRLGHYQELINRLLAKDSAKRMSSARELIEALEQALDQKPRLDAAIAGC
jgi:serine/threonine protein kinase